MLSSSTTAALTSTLANNPPSPTTASIPDEKESPTIAAIRKCAAEEFGLHDLSTETLEQLSWLQNNSVATSECNVKLAAVAPSALHVEIRRALARINCLNLLRQADEKAYTKFTTSQSENKLEAKSFEMLAAMIKTHAPAAQKALEASCFITMSDTAKQAATAAGVTFSLDSEKFVTDTVTACPEIYPICRTLDKESLSLLPIAFLKDTHGRHMMYTEGGNNMFAVLREKIAARTLSKAEYELWFSRWIINIAGFRGHLNPFGSIYLTQNTANAIFALKHELDKLWSNVHHDVLKNYLLIRAQWLNVEDNLLLAHLGCMLRKFSPAEGAELNAWFARLSAAEKLEYQTAYDNLRSMTEVTPTYEPAVFDALIALKCTVAQAIEIHSQITKMASTAYLEKIKNGEINAKTTPLCFRDIANQKNLNVLLNHFRESGHVPAIAIDASGNVNVVLPSPAPELDVAPRTLGMR